MYGVEGNAFPVNVLQPCSLWLCKSAVS